MLTKKQKEYSNHLKQYKEIFCVGIYYYGIEQTQEYSEVILDSKLCSELIIKDILIPFATNRYMLKDIILD